MDDFIYAMIKLLSLSPAESVNIVDYSLKKEIIKVKITYFNAEKFT